MSKDPIGFDGKDGNTYRYVGNSPTNLTDPTGLRETDDRWTNLTKSLVDVSNILEINVNQEIRQAWGRIHNAPHGKSYTAAVGAMELVFDIFSAFGKDQRGTTVYSFGPVARIGWLLDNQWLGAQPNQIFRMKFSQSRYLLNENPWNRPAKPVAL